MFGQVWGDKPGIIKKTFDLLSNNMTWAFDSSKLAEAW